MRHAVWPHSSKPATDNRFPNRPTTIRDLLKDTHSERFRADLIGGAITGLTWSMVFSPNAREPKIAEVKGEIDALNGRPATRKNAKNWIG